MNVGADVFNIFPLRALRVGGRERSNERDQLSYHTIEL